MATPLPWSHTALNGFETCARQFEEVKVLRNYQDTQNEAALWGDAFHKAAEKWIGAEVAGAPIPLPDIVQNYHGYLRQFVDRPGDTYVERQYALDRQLAPCDFLDPPGTKRVWCRGIIDVLTLLGKEAWVDDHKTGKRKVDNQQLVIFALLVFYHHPEIETVHTAFHWVKTNEKDSKSFHRSQIAELWATLTPKLERYKAAFHSGIFPPRPSGLCKRHCPVDTCEYHGGGRR
jgi:hypothetical protein